MATSPRTRESAHTNVNLFSVAALGVIAYVTETLLHELGGHGSVCLLSGGKITLLAPLYMRCSVETVAIVAAGPATNFVAGLLCLLALQIPAKQTGAFRYFLWLSLCFNWLVAAGYLLVGAATGFGDWPAIFAHVQPAWMWRVPVGLAGAGAYFVFLRSAEDIFRRIASVAKPDRNSTARLILVPTAAAAVVALAAEAYGQGAQPLGLALAFGCTLFIGFTLMGVGGASGARPAEGAIHIPFNAILLALAVLAAAGFVLVVGPGVDVSRF